MVMTIGLTNAPDALERVLVAQMAPQGIARVRRIRDHAAIAHDLHGTADQPELRSHRMKLEILAQRALTGQWVARECSRGIWAIIRGLFPQAFVDPHAGIARIRTGDRVLCRL